MYITARSASQGRIAGLVSVLAIETANFTQAVAAALGLSAILYSSALAFDIVKYLGKMPYLLESQKMQIGMQMQMMQQQAAMTGQSPPPPDPQMQIAQAMLAAPSWENISEKLRDQYERTYRIDVETNSTVDLEATEDKAQIAEFMNAWGQMMSGITPLVESGAMPFEAAKVVMGEVFRRLRFARRVEQALDSIQQPQPKETPKLIEDKAIRQISLKPRLRPSVEDQRDAVDETQKVWSALVQLPRHPELGSQEIIVIG